MKAACSRLTEAARGTVPMCDRLNKGMCRPGGPGEEACKTQVNQDKHTSKCVEVDTNLGYTCDCDPGMAAWKPPPPFPSCACSIAPRPRSGAPRGAGRVV